MWAGGRCSRSTMRILLVRHSGPGTPLTFTVQLEKRHPRSLADIRGTGFHGWCVVLMCIRTQPQAMARVIASLDAMIEMGRRLGLRAQVQERLLAVLDAALEMRKLPGGGVDGAAPLILRVGDVEVAYALDLDSESVHILSVDAFRDGKAEDHWPFGWRSVGDPRSRS